MAMKLYASADDHESKGYLPLDIEQLTELQAQGLVYDLQILLLAFKVRPIKDWELSVRACNVLKRNFLETVWDLQQLTTNQILKLPSCGTKSTLEIYTVAKVHGIELLHWIEAVTMKYASDHGHGRYRMGK